MTLMSVSCFQNYQVEERPQKFEEINNPNFNWKSTSETKLEFLVPDNQSRQNILVEVFYLSQQGQETKSVSQFLSPGEKFSQVMNLANHVVSIKVKMSHGKIERVREIDVEKINSVTSIYFDVNQAKGE